MDKIKSREGNEISKSIYVYLLNLDNKKFEEEIDNFLKKGEVTSYREQIKVRINDLYEEEHLISAQELKNDMSKHILFKHKVLYDRYDLHKKNTAPLCDGEVHSPRYIFIKLVYKQLFKEDIGDDSLGNINSLNDIISLGLKEMNLELYTNSALLRILRTKGGIKILPYLNNEFLFSLESDISLDNNKKVKNFLRYIEKGFTDFELETLKKASSTKIFFDIIAGKYSVDDKEYLKAFFGNLTSQRLIVNNKVSKILEDLKNRYEEIARDLNNDIYESVLKYVNNLRNKVGEGKIQKIRENPNIIFLLIDERVHERISLIDLDRLEYIGKNVSLYGILLENEEVFTRLNEIPLDILKYIGEMDELYEILLDNLNYEYFKNISNERLHYLLENKDVMTYILKDNVMLKNFQDIEFEKIIILNQWVLIDILKNDKAVFNFKQIDISILKYVGKNRFLYKILEDEILIKRLLAIDLKKLETIGYKDSLYEVIKDEYLFKKLQKLEIDKLKLFENKGVDLANVLSHDYEEIFKVDFSY